MREDSTETASTIRHDAIIQTTSNYHNKPVQSSQAKMYAWRAGVILATAVVCIVLSIVSKGIDPQAEAIKFRITNFLLYAFLWLFLFFTFTIALIFLERILRARHNNAASFIIGIINNYPSLLGVVLSSVIISHIIEYRKARPLPSQNGSSAAAVPESQAGDSSKSDLISNDKLSKYIEMVFDNNLESLYSAITMAASIFLLKSIILFALNYSVHFSHYSERINQNTEKINLLKTLNDKINAGYSDDFDVICTQLVHTLAKDGSLIRLQDLRAAITEEAASRAFLYMNKTENEAIGFDDLRAFYVSTVSEQQQLSSGLQQQSTAANTLDFVCMFFCVPIAISAFFTYLKNDTTSKSSAAVMISGVISGGYVFSDVIKNFIGSVIFVFFIRPFEVDDFVMIESNLYRVREMNLLSSVLTKDMLHTIFPNSKLVSMAITNYRVSKTWECKYNFTFELAQFEKKRGALLGRLNLFIKNSPTVFKRKAYFSDLKVVSATSISASIVVGFNLEIVDMKTLRRNQENFVIDLDGIIREVGLIPFKN